MSFNTAIDDITWAALKRGSRLHQSQVYQTYERAVWTLALRLLGNEATAWDVSQGAFLRAFERIDQLKQREQFGYWLRRIVINQVTDTLRRPVESLPEHFDQTAGDGDMDVAMDLERALAQLSEWDRMVLWLHDVEGFKHSEIADSLNQSVPWSKTRLSRSRARMRELMALAPFPSEEKQCHGR